MLREIGGVVSGVVTWFIVANDGSGVLRVTWPGYFEAETANPNEMSANAVRTQAIRVRSYARNVRS
jgi:hypothetical protein